MADLPPGMDEQAAQLPAVFVNHMQISKMGDVLVRIVFAEAFAKDALIYRTALVMTVADAHLLATLLEKILKAMPVPQPQGSRPN